MIGKLTLVSRLPRSSFARPELVVAALELLVGRLQLLRGGLELLVDTLHLLAAGEELLVGRANLLVGRLLLAGKRLIAFTRGPELATQPLGLAGPRALAGRLRGGQTRLGSGDLLEENDEVHAVL